MTNEKNIFVHPSAIIDEPCQIGANTHIWHFSHLMAECQIGKNCIIGQNVFIASRVTVGDNCKIQNNVSLYTGVICGDDVFVGPSAVFTNVINPRATVERKNEFRLTKIATGASIGANATIVCGNCLGQYCLIGAGTVVTKDVPDFALVVGNPGRIVGWVSQYGERLQFDEKGCAICPMTGELYVLKNGVVRLVEKCQ